MSAGRDGLAALDVPVPVLLQQLADLTAHARRQLDNTDWLDHASQQTDPAEEASK